MAFLWLDHWWDALRNMFPPLLKGKKRKCFQRSKDGIRMHSIKCKLGALKTQCSCFEWAQPDFFILATQDFSDTILALPWNTPWRFCWWNPSVFTGCYVPDHCPGPIEKYGKQNHSWDRLTGGRRHVRRYHGILQQCARMWHWHSAPLWFLTT